MSTNLRQLTGALFAALVISGCGGKSDEEAASTDSAAPTAGNQPAAPAAPAPGKETLPGENSVRDMLAKKDYDRAVGALVALRGAAVAPPQTEAYMNLFNEVKFALMDASASDPKAANALMTLRASAAGR